MKFIILLSILPIICTKSVFKNITSIVGFDDKCINSINDVLHYVKTNRYCHYSTIIYLRRNIDNIEHKQNRHYYHKTLIGINKCIDVSKLFPIDIRCKYLLIELFIVAFDCSIICYNNGTCNFKFYNNRIYYYCKCTTYYSGHYCEVDNSFLQQESITNKS